MATLIHHYYFSSEITSRYWYNDPITGIQPEISEDTLKSLYCQTILTSSNFPNNTSGAPEKWNSNPVFMPIKGKKGIWFINYRGAFQSLPL